MASILETVKENNANILRLLLAVPSCIPEKELNFSILLAAKSGFSECTQLLLAANVDPDHTDTNNNTALKLAAEAGHAEIIRILARGGCDINAVNSSGATALHAASTHGHDQCVATLIEVGAKTDTADSAGNTPLIRAAKNCRRSLGTMRRLVAAKCKLDKQDNVGRTALHYCCHQAFGAEILLVAGANPNVQDKEGNTPIVLAATEGFDSIIRCLLAHDCDPDIPNMFNKRAIHWLAMKNHCRAIEDIAHAGGDVNCLDDKNNSPLWYAVNHNRPEAVKALLKANCCLDPPRESDLSPVGGDPLKTALEKKLYGIARLLVLAGCEVSPVHAWIEVVERQQVERTTERRVTLWVEEAEEDEEDRREQEELDQTLQWLKEWIYSPHSLKQLCRIFIRNLIGLGVLKKAEQLPLPAPIVDYVTLKELEDHLLEGFLM